MTFAEADAQYETVKQRYLSGALTDEQYDDQLHDLMVQDDLGRWWARSREKGDWHYYDGAAGSWLLGAPPVDAPPDLPRPAAPQSGVGAPTSSPSSAPSPPAPSPLATWATPGADRAALPKWAAVAPASVQPPAAGSAGRGGRPAPAVPAAGGYRVGDFAPLPELRGSLKLVFFALALLVPLVGFVLYFVYRHKPAGADRSAARIFLILGVVSLVFYSLAGAAIMQLESMSLRTG